MSAHDTAQPGSQQSHVLLLMLINLLIGTVMSLVAQYVTDMDVADNAVQAMAWTKYVFTVAVAWLLMPGSSSSSTPSGGTDSKAAAKPDSEGSKGGGSGSKDGVNGSSKGGSAALTPRGRRLTIIIGVLDVISYVLLSIGFVLCGAATAIVWFAAAGQVFTALLTRFALKRKLRRGQLAAVALVVAGIMLRGGGSSSSGKQEAGSTAEPPSQGLGVTTLLASAAGYSVLGVYYDILVRTETPAPSHSQIMSLSSKIGLAAMTAYEVAFVVPSWRQLVTSHLQTSGHSAAAAIAALSLYGIIYVCHTYAKGLLQRADGALAVGLVSAVRSATVGIGTHLAFCNAAAPWQCLSARKAVSAAVVTAGGVVWVLSGSGKTAGGKKDKEN